MVTFLATVDYLDTVTAHHSWMTFNFTYWFGVIDFTARNAECFVGIVSIVFAEGRVYVIVCFLRNNGINWVIIYRLVDLSLF